MLQDRDFIQFRQTYYRLFVQLLWKEPETAFIAALRDDMHPAHRSRGGGASPDGQRLANH